jgi:hypothetical protein
LRIYKEKELIYIYTRGSELNDV